MESGGLPKVAASESPVSLPVTKPHLNSQLSLLQAEAACPSFLPLRDGPPLLCPLQTCTHLAVPALFSQTASPTPPRAPHPFVVPDIPWRRRDPGAEGFGALLPDPLPLSVSLLNCAANFATPLSLPAPPSVQGLKGTQLGTGRSQTEEHL